MTQPIHEKGVKVYKTYTFSGIWQRKLTGIELLVISLQKCLEDCYNTSFQRTMKDFCSCGFHFDIREATAEDIRTWVEKGYIILPFDETVKRTDVLDYIKAGLKPVFMKSKDFKSLQKEYAVTA